MKTQAIVTAFYVNGSFHDYADDQHIVDAVWRNLVQNYGPRAVVEKTYKAATRREALDMVRGVL